MPSTQAIFSATQLQTRRAAPLTQSAAFMVDNAIYSTKFSQLDTLLGGGLKQGFILELSGPPGCIKELLAVNLVSSFIEESKHVIFVGKSYPSRRCHPIMTGPDMQNMTSPATLNRVLRSKCVMKPALVSMTYSHPFQRHLQRYKTPRNEYNTFEYTHFQTS